MAEPTLGTLEIRNVRELWKHEERDFTPWLAKNIDQLASTLGIQIIVEETEKRVGAYELDIFGRTDNNGIVIIENQLEETDNPHLGQLLTYAAGLDAATIIWVAPVIRDEQRRAIEWLNLKTADDVSFFLVRPEVLSINGSLPAVRFILEAAPSAFSRRLKNVAREANGPAQEFYSRLWEALCPYLAGHGHPWARRRSTPTGSYIYRTVGRSGATVNVSVNRASSRISVSLYFEGPRAKEYFDSLASVRPLIDAEFNSTGLIWDRRDNQIASTVYAERPFKPETLLAATPEQEEFFFWIATCLTSFSDVAKRYLVAEPSAQ